MRLLSANTDGSFSLTEFDDSYLPGYAILSHTWEQDDQEVSYQNVTRNIARHKRGWKKLRFCQDQADKNGLRYFWVDSCCIDKRDARELSIAINSMFRWYNLAAKCFVYLADVSKPKSHDPAASSWKRFFVYRTDVSESKSHDSSASTWEEGFMQSRWWKRGWTLQELLAPRSVEFFSKECESLGSKQSLEQTIHEITNIPIRALQGHLAQFNASEKRAWAKDRETKYEEDQVYCLAGLLEIYLPLNYGEGKENASRRLQDEIERRSPQAKGDLNVTSSQTHKLSKDEQRLMHALRASARSYEQFKDRNPDSHKGTCRWVVEHPNFRKWKDSESSGLLWVSADPGCGKSVLAKSLVDKVLQPSETRAVCYFFFKDDAELQKRSSTALPALLHQLLKQKPRLLKHAMADFETDGDKFAESVQTSWRILTRIVEDPLAGEIVCVLDALDECIEADRFQLIKILSQIFP